MSISNTFVRVLGALLALVGFALLLSVVGLRLGGIGFEPWWAELLVGFLFFGVGIYVVHGGNIVP